MPTLSADVQKAVPNTVDTAPQKAPRQVSERRQAYLARREANKTPEQRQQDLRRQEAKYAVDKFIDKKQHERRWFNPRKYLVGMTEAVVKMNVARRVTKAMKDNGINIVTEDFVREASKLALRRILNRGEQEKLQSAAGEATQLSGARLVLQGIAEGSTSTMERMSQEQMQQMSALTGDIYAKIINPYVREHPNIPQEGRREGRLPLPTSEEITRAQQQLAEIIKIHPEASGLNSNEIARAMLLLAREIRTAGITASDTESGKQFMEGKLFSTGPVAEMDRIYRERLVLMAAQWGKNIGFGILGLSMANPATLPLYLAGTFGAYMFLNYRKLSLERTVRTIDKARGTLQPTPENQKLLGRLWSVDWNKMQSDGTLGTKGDMWAAVLARSGFGTATGAAMFFLGHNAVSEGVAKDVSQGLGNLFGKAGEVIHGNTGGGTSSVDSLQALAAGHGKIGGAVALDTQQPQGETPSGNELQQMMQWGALANEDKNALGSSADRLQEVFHSAKYAGEQGLNNFGQWRGENHNLPSEPIPLGPPQEPIGIPGTNDTIILPQGWHISTDGHLIVGNTSVGTITDSNGQIAVHFNPTFAAAHGIAANPEPFSGIPANNVLEVGGYRVGQWEWRTGLWQPGVYSHNELTMYVSNYGHNPPWMPDGAVGSGVATDGHGNLLGMNIPDNVVPGRGTIKDDFIQNLIAGGHKPNVSDMVAAVRLNNGQVVLIPMQNVDGHGIAQLPPELFSGGQLHNVHAIATALVTDGQGHLVTNADLANLHGSLPADYKIVSLASDDFPSNTTPDINHIVGGGSQFDLTQHLGGGTGGEEFELGRGTIFEPGFKWLVDHPALAAGVAIGAIGFNLGMNDSLNRNFGLFNPPGGSRTRVFVHLATLGAIEATIFAIPVVGPGIAVFAGLAYVSPYAARILWGGAVGLGQTAVRVVTGGRYGNPPTGPAAPATGSGGAAPAATVGGTTGTPTTPPGGTPPTTTPTTPGATTPGATPPAGATPAPRPLNAATPLTGPTLQAAQQFGTNPRGRQLPVRHFLRPGATRADQQTVQRQLQAMATPLQQAIEHQRNSPTNVANRAAGNPAVAVHMEDIAHDLAQGITARNPIDLANENNAQFMATAALHPLGDFSPEDHAILTEAIRRAAIAQQERNRLIGTSSTDLRALQDAMERAFNRMREPGGVDSTIPTDQLNNVLITETTALRNAFMQHGNPADPALTPLQRAALRNQQIATENALNYVMTVPSGTPMTPGMRAVVAAAAHESHAWYYDIPAAHQDAIYARRAQAALQGAGLRFGERNPSDPATVQQVLTELHASYQHVPYIGSTEEQRVRAIQQAIGNIGGASNATFDQQIHAITTLTTDERQKVVRSVQLIHAGNTAEILGVARALKAAGVDVHEVRLGIRNTLSHARYTLTPVENAALETIYDTSANAPERVKRGMQELGARPTPAEVADAIVSIYYNAGITPMNSEILRDILVQTPEIQRITHIPTRANIADEAYHSTLHPASATADQRASIALAALGIPKYDAAHPYTREQIEILNMGIRTIRAVSGGTVDIQQVLETELGFDMDARKYFAKGVVEVAIRNRAPLQAVLSGALDCVISPASTPEEIAELVREVTSVRNLPQVRSAADIDAVVTSLGLGSDHERAAIVLGGLINRQRRSAAEETVHLLHTRSPLSATQSIDVARGLLRVIPNNPKQIHDAFVAINGTRADAVVLEALNNAPAGMDLAETGRFAVMVSGIRPIPAEVEAVVAELEATGMDTPTIRQAMQAGGFTPTQQTPILETVLRNRLPRPAGLTQNQVRGAIERALAVAGVASTADLRRARTLTTMRTNIENILTRLSVDPGVASGALNAALKP